MKIYENREKENLLLQLEGRLDTTTAPQFEAVIEEKTSGITDLQIDMEKLEYISSAGLRILLGAVKKMNKQGSMVVRNVNSEVMEVFKITGFTEILNIQ
ncbi:STAS domain-containing protein [Clostridium boliviensis]|uniref:Anti-sigma factor antagonist n=1 Tax=Clostridium boliviensis TaxID=318465 RepID=A0ABU4GIH7_9CLOT|nr:STAS domain-containing protein [Clostridium boliviensis]MDW2797410.1 STAS domain-containing protein [Clostridium boliviensis]